MTRVVAFLRETRGSAATEMALLIPLLLTLMFAGFESGHYFYQEQKIIKAVREGARFAGRQPFSAFPCGGAADPATVTSIKQVTRTGTLTGTNPRIPGWDINDINVTFRCDANFTDDGIFSGTTGGAPVVLVSASADYPSFFEALGVIDSSAIVQASAEAVVNGI